MESVEKILQQKFGKVKKAARGYVRIPCPTCDAQHSKKMKRYVHTEKLTSHCYICGRRLTLKELTGSEFQPIAGSTPAEPDKPHEWAKKLPTAKPVPLNELPKDHPAIKFLEKDHLFEHDRYYSDYGIVYVPSDQGVVLYSYPFITSAERLIFPVKFKNELVGWQMRSVPGTFYGDREKDIRYIHLFDKGSYLFGYDQAKEYSMVVVFEGVKKALKVPNGVATLGKGISAQQMQLIRQWKNVTMFLDSGEDAQYTARELCAHLRVSGCNVVNIDPMEFGFPSPDEMTSDEVAQAIYSKWNPQ